MSVWAAGAGTGAAVCLLSLGGLIFGGGPTTWHVRTDGSNANCSGLTDAADPGTGTTPRDCAFATPQKGVNVAGAGDTVLIHAGTYTTAGTTVQGVSALIGIDRRTQFTSEATRLTIRSAGDGDVVFDGQDTIDTGIFIWGTSYVTVQGLTLRHFTADKPDALTYGASGVSVGSPGASFPSSKLVLDTLTVELSSLDHASGPFAEIAIWCEECRNNSILDARIESVEPVGIALGSDSPVTVDQNAAVSGSTLIRTRDLVPWVGLLAFHTNGGLFDGGFIDQRSDPDSATDLLLVRNSKAWSVRNSVFYRPPRSGIRFVDDVEGANLSEGSFIVNNTVECTETGGAAIRVERLNSSRVENNALVGCSSGVLLGGDDSFTQLGYNDFFQVGTLYDPFDLTFGYSLIGHDLLVDPLFTQADPRPDPFYRPTSDSPLIDAGDDAVCGVVPADGACDIGAFQAPPGGGVPPDTPSIVSVTDLTGRSAILHGSTFHDDDSEDIHLASQWQVDLVGGDFSTPVHDSGRTLDDLTSHKATGLAALTTYISRVRYQDSNNNWSEWSDPAQDSADQFTTLSASAIPPKVDSVVPANGAKDIDVDVQPVLSFNVPLAPSSVTTSSVKLLRKTFAVAQDIGSPILQGGGSDVRIRPADRLNPNTTYTIVVVAGRVLSLEGNVPGRAFSSTFTTETALLSSSPADGETNVAVTVVPHLTFKWTLDGSTISPRTFKMTDLTTGGKIGIESVQVSGASVTLHQARALKAGHRYRIIVVAGANGLRFADGRYLGKAIKITFRTG